MIDFNWEFNATDSIYSTVNMTPKEQSAWALYCDETKGGMNVADFWHELSPKVQSLYLESSRILAEGSQ